MASVAGAAALVAACSQPPKPVAAAGAATPSGPQSSRQALTPAEAPRIGTVGLIRELKDRGMTVDNWAGVIGSVFTNDTEKDVIRVRYEVTVFYRDGTQGVLVLDQRPSVQTGQRVRVTGDRIEPLER
jgi:hypothetical protein